ncbi:putative solute carrier family 41 member 1 [Apostichopus japonicus]|uniref:Putative solute carrier family 41 member 1 n=1 Tax=Stichopus japonicus TaxID=307972 RepID=A0A2G8KYA7_STIJA|nr:putative solute carrier family 41 member 1 [Apostichopus japonicus]
MSKRTGITDTSGDPEQNVLRKRRPETPSAKMVPRVTNQSHDQSGDHHDSSAIEMSVRHREEAKQVSDSVVPHRNDPPSVHDRTNTVENGTAVITAEVDSMEDEEEEDGDEQFMSQRPLLTPDKDATLPPHARDNIMVKIESSQRILLQVFLPFLIAGFGTVAAGLVLDAVQHWPVFVNVSEVFILVPALLGLKGNLEMTLASRLSTAANLGSMDNSEEKWRMIGGNMALTQCQAIIVGFLAAVVAVLFGWLPDGEFSLDDVLLLCASSLVTASLASGILGSVMVVVILISRKLRINPDNIATPIAASLGDLITLALLSWISDKIYSAVGVDHWLAPSIIAAFFLILPVWAVISHRNKYTNDVFYYGWSPVISAMLISSCGGLVLDVAIRQNQGVAVFSPVINGVGGNLVAVQASRLSTALHSLGPPGTLIPGRTSVCQSPFKIFFGSGQQSKSARVLFFLVIPGQMIFLFLIAYANAGHNTINFRVTSMYICVALVQVALLLVIADCIIHIIWKRKNDPDNFAIPYLTALGDVIGTSLLALGFYLVWLIGDRDSDIGD